MSRSELLDEITKIDQELDLYGDEVHDTLGVIISEADYNERGITPIPQSIFDRVDEIDKKLKEVEGRLEENKS